MANSCSDCSRCFPDKFQKSSTDSFRFFSFKKPAGIFTIIFSDFIRIYLPGIHLREFEFKSYFKNLSKDFYRKSLFFKNFYVFLSDSLKSFSGIHINISSKFFSDNFKSIILEILPWILSENYLEI